MERASQRINQIYLVGVDSDTEEARVGVDKLVNISDPQVPEDRGVIEVGQVGHVNATVKLGRVDLANHLTLVGLDLRIGICYFFDVVFDKDHLAIDVDGKLLARVEGVISDVFILHETFEVSADLLVGVWNPAGLLWVVGLLLLLRADVVLHLQPRAGVRIRAWSGNLSFSFQWTEIIISFKDAEIIVNQESRY